MKKEKFTPGPWVILSDEIVEYSAYNSICNLNDNYGDIIENAANNAALIAAAPELYEALKAAITEIESFTDFKISGPDSQNEILNGLYSTLAKARGENVE